MNVRGMFFSVSIIVDYTRNAPAKPVLSSEPNYSRIIQDIVQRKVQAFEFSGCHE
jgi:hypothetical protein